MFIDTICQTIEGIMNAKTSGAYILILLLIIQFLTKGIIFLLSKSLSLNIAFPVLVVIVPIIFVVSLFPSINGLGIREGAYVYFWVNWSAGEMHLLYLYYFSGFHYYSVL